eukprot:SAG31_NODE_47036_length_252_cov_0.549020_1_plen_83_part_11
MSGPKGNPAYKWVEIWYDDWDTLKVKYAHAQAAGAPHESTLCGSGISHLFACSCAGARGVGFWTADATQLHPLVISKMWAAVP